MDKCYAATEGADTQDNPSSLTCKDCFLLEFISCYPGERGLKWHLFYF